MLCGSEYSITLVLLLASCIKFIMFVLLCLLGYLHLLDCDFLEDSELPHFFNLIRIPMLNLAFSTPISLPQLPGFSSLLGNILIPKLLSGAFILLRMFGSVFNLLQDQAIS